MNPDLTTTINAYSWSEATNLLFLSQPAGVGFSYAAATSSNGTVDTTQKAAVAAWHVLQELVGNLSSIDSTLRSHETSISGPRG